MRRGTHVIHVEVFAINEAMSAGARCQTRAEALRVDAPLVKRNRVGVIPTDDCGEVELWSLSLVRGGPLCYHLAELCLDGGPVELLLLGGRPERGGDLEQYNWSTDVLAAEKVRTHLLQEVHGPLPSIVAHEIVEQPRHLRACKGHHQSQVVKGTVNVPSSVSARGTIPNRRGMLREMMLATALVTVIKLLGCERSSTRMTLKRFNLMLWNWPGYKGRKI